jgi:hypothetical protein
MFAVVKVFRNRLARGEPIALFRSMNSYDTVHYHVRLDHLSANFAGGPDGSLVFGIHELTASISRDGLAALAASLIPDQPLEISIQDKGERSGATIAIQATRFGFNPRIIVTLALGDALAGSILINVDPSNRWSPLDRVMLGIAQHSLNKAASELAGLLRLRTGVYQLDLQRFIRELLVDNNAPVRWDTQLKVIEGADERVRVEFVSFPVDEKGGVR